MRRCLAGIGRALSPMALLMAALTGAASADGLQPGREFSRHDLRCRDAAAAGEPAGCVRIRGYIPAASDRAGATSLDQPPSPFEPLVRTFVAGVGVVAAPIGAALGQVPLFVPARQTEGLR